MTSPASLTSLTGAIVPSTGAIPIAAAPRQIAPVILSFDAANYTKWAIFMRATLGRARLLGHIDGTIAATPTDSEWTAADYTFLNALHFAIDEDVADMVLARDQMACQLWLAALELFSANKASKEIFLDNDFCKLIQGDQSITAYLRRQKQLVDALADNDSPVFARALLLNTLRGLGPRFAAVATVISMTDPLPLFLRVRSMLLMEEMQQANAAANRCLRTFILVDTCWASKCRGL
jgi:hypothetical protein